MSSEFFRACTCKIFCTYLWGSSRCKTYYQARSYGLFGVDRVLIGAIFEYRCLHNRARVSGGGDFTLSICYGTDRCFW